MSPAAAVVQLLAEAIDPFRRELEELGITTTIDSKTDPLSGAVVCSYTFTVRKALAERLASERV